MPSVLLENLSKTYSDTGIRACRDVHLVFPPGRITALVGDNGSGKSTLLHILTGLIRPDSGNIRIADQPLEPGSPMAAREAGISMVQQQPVLAHELTLEDNLLLGLLPAVRKRSKRYLTIRLRQISQSYGLAIPLDKKAADASLEERQNLQTLIMLLNGSRICLFDEPVLLRKKGKAEQENKLLLHLAASGRTVILISHKFETVQAVSDEIVFMREGRAVILQKNELKNFNGVLNPGNGDGIPDEKRNPEPVFSIRRGSSFDITLSAGESRSLLLDDDRDVVELESRLAGLVNDSVSEVQINGQFVSEWNYKAFYAGGGRLVPSRQEDAVVPGLTIKDHIMSETDAPFLFSRRKAEDQLMRMKRLLPFQGQLDDRISSLSGGHIKRFLIASALVSDPVLMIVSHPGRALDVNTISVLKNVFLDFRNNGGSLVLLFSDREEHDAFGDIKTGP